MKFYLLFSKMINHKKRRHYKKFSINPNMELCNVYHNFDTYSEIVKNMESKWRKYNGSKFIDMLNLWFWELEQYANWVDYEMRTEFYRQNESWTPTQKEAYEIDKTMEKENELIKFFDLFHNE